MAELAHDDVTRLLATTIENGVAEINKANEVLLAEESGTGVREIDKALKENSENEDFDKEAAKFWAAAEKARQAYKDALEKARNAYRKNVLNEEAVETVEVDKDAVKEQRKMVMEAVNLLKTYATANGKKDVVAWVESLSIPQVGRQGTSNVGQKKPRAYVTVNGTRHESFGEAAKAASEILSTDENKVTVSSGDLVAAWDAAGEAAAFEYNGLTVQVEAKKSAAAAA